MLDFVIIQKKRYNVVLYRLHVIYEYFQRCSIAGSPWHKFLLVCPSVCLCVSQSVCIQTTLDVEIQLYSASNYDSNQQHPLQQAATKPTLISAEVQFKLRLRLVTLLLSLTLLICEQPLQFVIGFWIRRFPSLRQIYNESCRLSPPRFGVFKMETCSHLSNLRHKEEMEGVEKQKKKEQK